MYKSPITIIESTIDSIAKTVIEQRENAIFAQIQDSFGVDLDKHELIRALQYDRGQYEKGYADGKAEGKYTAHEVAEIIADLFGDACACNFNRIDEWLPEKCELLEACPYPAGVACWEQYLKFRERKDNG